MCVCSRTAHLNQLCWSVCVRVCAKECVMGQLLSPSVQTDRQMLEGLCNESSINVATLRDSVVADVWLENDTDLRDLCWPL